jgi:hypothetical protein
MAGEAKYYATKHDLAREDPSCALSGRIIADLGHVERQIRSQMTSMAVLAILQLPQQPSQHQSRSSSTSRTGRSSVFTKFRSRFID